MNKQTIITILKAIRADLIAQLTEGNLGWRMTRNARECLKFLRGDLQGVIDGELTGADFPPSSFGIYNPLAH